MSAFPLALFVATDPVKKIPVIVEIFSNLSTTFFATASFFCELFSLVFRIAHNLASGTVSGYSNRSAYTTAANSLFFIFILAIIQARMQKLTRLFEFRIFLILAIIALAWHLLAVLGSFVSIFTDIALLLFLSWILAFILEPLVVYLSIHGLQRIFAAIIIYLAIALLLIGLLWIVLPTSIVQFSQLGASLPQNPLVAPQLQNFITTALSNSVAIASQVASGLTGIVLVFIISFYLLIYKADISKGIKGLIPDEYEDDYEFFESVINTTFASFLRVQVFLSLILGLVTFVVLSILRVEFALSTSVAATVLAMIPVIGGILFALPPAVAALTISLEKAVIVMIVLALTAQLVYNFVAPKLLGNALKIHPIIVLLSFLIGYKLAGVWGAVFAVPITSSLTVIGKDLLKYWKQEADK